MSIKEKGLGRGLDSLFGDDYTDSAAPSGGSGAETLPIHRVEPNPEQPRRDFDPEELQALADSLSRHGMISPIAVRDLGNGRYGIIAGERRWRAARMAGFTQVPVTILEADDARCAELALVENLQRQDLNPVEEAKGFLSLSERFGLTQEQVADRVGRSRSAVANALRLLTLPEPVLDLLENGSLTAGHARAVLSLSGDEDREALARRIVAEKLSVRQAEALAARLSRPAGAAKAPSEDAMYYDACGSALSSRLGRKVTIRPGRKKGVLELEYYDLDDFQRLYEFLGGAGTKETGNG